MSHTIETSTLPHVEQDIPDSSVCRQRRKPTQEGIGNAFLAGCGEQQRPTQASSTQCDLTRDANFPARASMQQHETDGGVLGSIKDKCGGFSRPCSG
jgi:hypothetical protein